MKFLNTYKEALIVSFCYFLILLFTLSHYGMHEDNPFHFLRGQAYLQKIFTENPQFNLPKTRSPVLFYPYQRISLYKPNASEDIGAPLRFTEVVGEKDSSLQKQHDDLIEQVKRRVSFYKHNAWTVNYWNTFSQSHPAVSDIIMAVSNRLIYGAFGLLGDIEAYHIYIILSLSFAVLFVFIFCQKAFGKRSAWFAAISFILFPSLFAEAHFNIKDPVQMSFFTIAVVSFYIFITEKFKSRWFYIFIFSIFLALGTKWNIFFLPFIIIPWLFSIRSNPKIRQFLRWKYILLFAFLTIVIPFVLLIMSWPLLWTNPVQKLFDVFGFYSTLGVRDPRVEIGSFAPLPFGLDARAVIFIGSMTQPAMLFLFFIGIVAIFAYKIKTTYNAHLLVLFWLFIPILRVIWSEVSIYGALRNFIEYFPAFAVIAGIGADFIVKKLNDKFKIPLLGFILFVLYLIILLIPLVKLHPNENLYFNSLIGGIKGAKKIGAYNWYLSYDNLYRQGVNWLNANGQKNTKLAYLDGTMLAIAPDWLRRDIRFGSYFSGFEQKGEYIMSLIYPSNPPAVFTYYFLDRFLKPIHVISIDGEIVFKIWKNEPQYLRKEVINLVKLPEKYTIQKEMKYNKRIWNIVFDKPQKLIKLVVNHPTGNCLDRDGVWSLNNNGKDFFFKPLRISLNVNRSEFYFPGEETSIVRFWDIEGKLCLYDAKIEAILTQ